jgi:hypothetical protein
VLSGNPPCLVSLLVPAGAVSRGVPRVDDHPMGRTLVVPVRSQRGRPDVLSIKILQYVLGSMGADDASTSVQFRMKGSDDAEPRSWVRCTVIDFAMVGQASYRRLRLKFAYFFCRVQEGLTLCECGTTRIVQQIDEDDWNSDGDRRVTIRIGMQDIFTSTDEEGYKQTEYGECISSKLRLPPGLVRPGSFEFLSFYPNRTLVDGSREYDGARVDVLLERLRRPTYTYRPEAEPLTWGQRLVARSDARSKRAVAKARAEAAAAAAAPPVPVPAAAEAAAAPSGRTRMFVQQSPGSAATAQPEEAVNAGHAAPPDDDEYDESPEPPREGGPVVPPVHAVGARVQRGPLPVPCDSALGRMLLWRESRCRISHVFPSSSVPWAVRFAGHGTLHPSTSSDWCFSVRIPWQTRRWNAPFLGSIRCGLQCNCFSRSCCRGYHCPCINSS